MRAELCIVPQSLYEMWVVLTRPASDNGIGMQPTEVKAEMDRTRRFFRFLDDNSKIFPIWETLVTQYAIKGKPAHDARLVAAMVCHGIEQLLTFNRTDFTRFTQITILEPEKVITGT